MSFAEILNQVLGSSGRYEFLYFIFGGVFALICVDNIYRFLFGSLSSLWGGRKR